jgi:hypothetical protein
MLHDRVMLFFFWKKKLLFLLLTRRQWWYPPKVACLPNHSLLPLASDVRPHKHIHSRKMHDHAICIYTSCGALPRSFAFLHQERQSSRIILISGNPYCISQPFTTLPEGNKTTRETACSETDPLHPTSGLEDDSKNHHL